MPQLNENTVNLQNILNTVNELPTATSGSVAVDDVLSTTSTNPVQNKIVTEALNGKANATHNQSASTITSGTFAGTVTAPRSSQAYSAYMLRNSRLASSNTNPSYNGEICWTYG
jgi:hypothetical protein